MIKFAKEEIETKIKQLSKNKETDDNYHIVIRTNDKRLVEKIFYEIKLKGRYRSKKEIDLYQPRVKAKNKMTQLLFKKLKQKIVENLFLKSIEK